MSLVSIGGNDAAGSAVAATLGNEYTVPDGKNIAITDFNGNCAGDMLANLQASTDGGTTWADVAEWWLAASGHLATDSGTGTYYSATGSGTNVRVRVRYINPAGAVRSGAWVSGQLI